MKLLALDTASAQCSVALLLDGALIWREAATARDHAQLILPMVDAVLAEAGLTLRQLDGIAFGRGPGSFTGVRVAASVTQGLALGAGLPVLPVSDLRALAEQALRLARVGQGVSLSGEVLACMDARMGEVYWSMQTAVAGELIGGEVIERVSGSDAVQTAGALPCCAAAGKGLAAWPAVTAQVQVQMQHVYAWCEPHARDITKLAAADLSGGAVWQDAALAQPVYLRDEVAKPTVRPPL